MLLGILICSEYEIGLIETRTISVMSQVFVKYNDPAPGYPDGYYVVKKDRSGKFFHRQMITPQELLNFITPPIMEVSK